VETHCPKLFKEPLEQDSKAAYVVEKGGSNMNKAMRWIGRKYAKFENFVNGKMKISEESKFG